MASLLGRRMASANGMALGLNTTLIHDFNARTQINPHGGGARSMGTRTDAVANSCIASQPQQL